ncbi:hypothetical protein BSKO_02239 [Bryopsis sp. KO-2023]|nr:hypothetical protein BSKO_02239 [Bryopsis sp. KO-2023]
MQENILFDVEPEEGRAAGSEIDDTREFATSMKSALDQRILSLENVVEELAEEVVVLRRRLESLESPRELEVEHDVRTRSISGNYNDRAERGDRSEEAGGSRGDGELGQAQGSSDIGVFAEAGGGVEGGQGDVVQIEPWENPPKGRDSLSLPSKEEAGCGPDSHKKKNEDSHQNKRRSVGKNLTSAFHRLVIRMRMKLPVSLGSISAVVAVCCLITSVMSFNKTLNRPELTFGESPSECTENQHVRSDPFVACKMCPWLD